MHYLKGNTIFMKLMLIFMLFYCSPLMGQNKIYDLQFTTYNGNNISMSDYKGKKILIGLISPGVICFTTV